MVTTYIVVTLLAAIAALIAAGIDVVRAEWVRGNMRHYGVPEWTLYPFAIIKAIGGIGLLVGLAIPPIGLAAAIGLVLYFVLAVLTVVRARWYAHIAYPLPYLALAAGSLALFAVS